LGGGGGGAGGDGGSSSSTGDSLAVRAWFLGDTTREGVASATAWEDFAVNLDGLDTQGDLTGHCASPFGESDDAPGGGDNSFGRNFVSFLSSIFKEPSTAATQSHDDGQGTLAFQVFPIDSRPDPLLGALRPLQDRIEDTWQLDPIGLIGDDPDAPASRFDEVAITDDRFEATASGRIGLRIWMQGAPLVLEIEQAVVMIDLDSQQATGEGILAGVIDTEALIEAFSPWLQEVTGGTDGLCLGDQLFEAVVQNIRGAQDMPLTGPQSENAACDGISIGLGLDLHQVSVDGVGELRVPSSNCD